MSETKLIGEPKEIASVKLVNELLVDIMGGLIPGFLFLFTIIIAVVIPIFCYTGLPHFFYANISQGSFWIVSFLALLIAAYVIGHIFYRADIKEPDQEGFKQQQESIIKNELEQILGANFEKRKDITETDVKNLENRLDQEIEHIYPNTCHPNGTNQEKVKCYFNKISCKIKEKPGGAPKTVDPDAFENKDQQYIKYYFEKIFYPSHKRSQKNINFEFDMEEKENISEYYDLIQEYLANLFVKYELSNSDDFLEEFKNKIYASKNNKTPNETVEKSDKKETLIEFIQHFILYCILKVRNETGCAIKSQCNFPYVYYNYYLKKRKETRLLKYVEWCDAASRTKNKINKMKIKIQMEAPSAYAILNKNESHIRMASSSWYVAKVGQQICKIVFRVSVILLVISCLYQFIYIVDIICKIDKMNFASLPCLIAEALSQNDDTHLKIYANICKSIIAVLCPLGTKRLLLYIYKKVIEFIHYQRLREIYYTLSVYDNFMKKRKA